MASFTITIPDNKLQTVLNAFAIAENYHPILDEAENPHPNPESKAQFAKRMILEYIKNVVKRAKDVEVEQARLQLEQEAETDSENITVG